MSLYFSVDKDIHHFSIGKKSIFIRKKKEEHRWKDPSSVLIKLIEKITTSPLSLSAVQLTVDRESSENIFFIYSFLQTLLQKELITFSLFFDNKQVASAKALSSSAKFPLLTKTKRIEQPILSSFAYLYKKENFWVMDSPLSDFSIKIHDPSLLAKLCDPQKDDPFTKDLFTYLSMLSMTTTAKENPEESFPLKSWELHDLIFHSHTRNYRDREPYGGTYRFLQKTPPLPLSIQQGKDAIALCRPDVSKHQKEGSFTKVLENRRSIRKFSKKPLTLSEVGEFLYRCAKFIEIKQNPETGDVAFSPCPSGGALHEIEIYLLANRCEGLEKDLYHYHKKNHSLTKLSVKSTMVSKLAKQCFLFPQSDHEPQLLFLLTARFQRISWKYEKMAYAAILKNVGALFQTMYLVATYMNLSPYAMGGGPSRYFDSLLEKNPLEESLVGEFALGK